MVAFHFAKVDAVVGGLRGVSGGITSNTAYVVVAGNFTAIDAVVKIYDAISTLAVGATYNTAHIVVAFHGSAIGEPLGCMVALITEETAHIVVAFYGSTVRAVGGAYAHAANKSAHTAYIVACSGNRASVYVDVVGIGGMVVSVCSHHTAHI